MIFSSFFKSASKNVALTLSCLQVAGIICLVFFFFFRFIFYNPQIIFSKQLHTVNMLRRTFAFGCFDSAHTFNALSLVNYCCG